jgi:hypothetical protein
MILCENAESAAKTEVSRKRVLLRSIVIQRSSTEDRLQRSIRQGLFLSFCRQESPKPTELDMVLRRQIRPALVRLEIHKQIGSYRLSYTHWKYAQTAFSIKEKATSLDTSGYSRSEFAQDLYSARNVVIGSARAARRAGAYDASSDTVSTNKVTAARTSGSAGRTP